MKQSFGGLVYKSVLSVLLAVYSITGWFNKSVYRATLLSLNNYWYWLFGFLGVFRLGQLAGIVPALLMSSTNPWMFKVMQRFKTGSEVDQEGPAVSVCRVHTVDDWCIYSSAGKLYAHERSGMITTQTLVVAAPEYRRESQEE